MFRCHSSGVISPTLRKTPRPALLIRMSRPPKARSMHWKKFWTSSNLLMSAGCPKTLPAPRSSAAARSTDSLVRPQNATEAPSCSRRSTIARPMPRVPPVTAATLPERDSISEFYATGTFSWEALVKMRTEMASSAPTPPLREILEERLSHLLVELEGLFDGQLSSQLERRLAPAVEKAAIEARDRARQEFADQLNQGARRIRQAVDVADLTTTLLDAAAPFAEGAAIFLVANGVARGERMQGVPDDRARAFRGLEIPLASAAALLEAAESGDPVASVTAPSEVSSELAVFAGHGESSRAFIYPVVVRGRTLALLYTRGAVQGAALELLAQLAPAELVNVPAGAAAATTAWDKLSPEEQQFHLRAQRFARVQVAEMRLYETDAVQAGRSQHDLYDALRERIDAARAAFRTSFFAPCPSMVDYLHLELVKTLAQDDPDALGKDYPGPMV